MFVGSKVEVMTHGTTIMLLALRVGGDGPNPQRLCNMLNTHVVLFPGHIKLNFYDQTVLKQLTTNKNLYNPRGPKTNRKLNSEDWDFPSGNKDRRV